MAHVAVSVRKRLNSALRKCEPKDATNMHHVPPREAVEEVRKAGQSIVAAADAALKLLDTPPSP